VAINFYGHINLSYVTVHPGAPVIAFVNHRRTERVANFRVAAGECVIEPSPQCTLSGTLKPWVDACGGEASITYDKSRHKVAVARPPTFSKRLGMDTSHD
jgi:hypothetical protein